MKLIDKFRELIGVTGTRASLENPSTSLSNPAAWLYSALGAHPTRAGVQVNEHTAAQLTAVYGCVRVLSSLVAMLPVNLYERTSTGRAIATQHPIQSLLHSAPNEEQTPYFYTQTEMTHALLWGNGYAGIVRGPGFRPVEMLPLLPDRTSAERSGGQLRYTTRLEDGTTIPISPSDIIHIPALGFDGVRGLSPVAVAREAFALGIAAEHFGATFFGRGGQVSGVLEHPDKVGEQAAKHLRDSWETLHGGANNAHRVAILEEGMKYARIGVPPEDAQFLETRKFQVSEICRLFGVPPHMVADLDRATFSNIEQQDLDLVRHTMLPWLVRFEQEYNRKLLRDSERARFFVKFNLEALLRGDVASRSAFYREMFGIGAMSQNEIREKEDLNSIPDGDRYFVPLNMAPADVLDDVLAARAPAPSSDDSRALIVRDAHEELFQIAAGNVCRREMAALEKCAKILESGETNEFLSALERAYEGVRESIAKHFRAPAAAIAASNGEASGHDGFDAHAYLLDLAESYCEQGMEEIREIELSAGALRIAIARWELIRPGKLSRAAFASAQLPWRNVRKMT